MTQWIDAAGFDDIDDEDVVRFDHDGRTYAIYRIDGHVYASDGMCTHERVHLADGLVIDHVIECRSTTAASTCATAAHCRHPHASACARIARGSRTAVC